MGFQYVEYDILSKNIRESIATEVKKHKLDENDIPRALKSLSIRHPERAIQCRYLLAVLTSLDKSDSKDKTCILNAAAFYVRNQIRESYQGTLTSMVLAPENSTLHNALTTSLNLTADNLPDSKDLLDMYDALSNFMHAYVYKDSDPSKGYLDKDQQVFSSRKIRSYKVETVLQDLVTKVATFKREQIEQTREQQLKDSDKIIKNRIGLFSDKVTSSPLDDAPVSQEPNASTPSSAM